MEFSVIVSNALIVLGASLLGYSIYPTSRIIRELPSGPVNLQWKILRGLIVFFIAGYLSYLFIFTAEHTTSHFLVSGIFFFGACFVLLVCLLALGTVRDVKRIATLEAETVTDPLMEIYNRRYLERRLEDEFTRARRYGNPFSLFLLDIDRFKEINDTYGHPTGDLVLKGMGALLKENIRTVDVPARYGGEEAVVLLPHTGLEGAEILAERFRKTVEAHLFPADASFRPGATLRCTISIGIAGLTKECSDAAQLLKQADTALYRAKQEGRNRTIAYRHG